MSFNIEITQGLEDRPIKVGIYGCEGIGKTTIASEFPGSLIIDTENGSSRINCKRVKCQSWENLLYIINGIIEDGTLCKTIVIDTLDKVETFCIDFLCNKFRKANIEDWGYGKGYTVLQDEMAKLFTLLDTAIEKGFHVVVIAHGKPRKYELPEEAGAFDRWELKLTKQVAPLFKEWCDILLFCNYKTYVVTTDNNTKKAQGGKRVMYTTHHACWDAKNRYGLPDELDLSFKGIAHLFKDAPESETKPKESPKKPTNEAKDKLVKLINDSKIKVEDLERVVVERGQYETGSTINDYSEEFITRWIFPNWQKITQAINKNNETKGDN